MTLQKLKFEKLKTVLSAVLVSAIMFLVFSSLIWAMFNAYKQREHLNTTDRYVTFSSKMERLIYNNITLLQGFQAYIKSNPDLNEDNAYDYLDNLLSQTSNYIRNVGVIRDTTIIWNYPRPTNSSVIGQDLSKVDAQKDLVLKVKNELLPIMQGPVDLLQGGTGFIIRLPIVHNDTGYWGQISIVLKSDKIIEAINSYAKDEGLDIAIFNHQNKITPFYGSPDVIQNSPLIFEIDPTMINWSIYVIPKDGWANHIFLRTFVYAIAFAISCFVGFITFKAMKYNYELFNISTHDALTGLYNRHFLNDYQELVLSKTKREKNNVGFMNLDLDHFKQINDTYGHNVGDMVLVETSRLLKAVTRTNDAVFRLGGDEFLIIYPKTRNRQELQVMKERILKDFKNKFHIPGYPIQMTISIGCSIFPEDGDNFDVLLHEADHQMYLEKSKQKQE